MELGYLSHRTAICGLHVYISRSAFGLDEATQDRAIARVLYFFEKHWEELLKFSRCTPPPATAIRSSPQNFGLRQEGGSRRAVHLR